MIFIDATDHIQTRRCKKYDNEPMVPAVGASVLAVNNLAFLLLFDPIYQTISLYQYYDRKLYV